MMNLLTTTALTFAVLVLVFRPLEVVFPAKPGQRFFRPGFLLDLCFFLGRHLVWGAVVFWLLLKLRLCVNGVVPAGFHDAVAHQPWWLQAVEAVLLSDLFMYWGHRLQHRVPFLWRFHAVHHSSEHMDWLAGHREHPLDSIYTMTLINLPPMALGFPLETIASFLLLRGIWAAYIHSNVRLPIGPLRWFVGAPELHHWHHDRDRDVGNYCNLSPLMDILFGTYYCPDHEPARFGVSEPTPRTYWGYMLQALLPRRWWRSAPGSAVEDASLPRHILLTLTPETNKPFDAWCTDTRLLSSIVACGAAKSSRRQCSTTSGQNFQKCQPASPAAKKACSAGR